MGGAERQGEREESVDSGSGVAQDRPVPTDPSTARRPWAGIAPNRKMRSSCTRMVPPRMGVSERFSIVPEMFIQFALGEFTRLWTLHRRSAASGTSPHTSSVMRHCIDQMLIGRYVGRLPPSPWAEIMLRALRCGPP